MDYLSVWDNDNRLQIAVYQVQGGPVCPYLVLHGKISKQVSAYHSLHQDLGECKAIIDYLIANPELPLVVKTSMYNAFIVQYSRCFTSNKRRGPTLNIKDVFKDADDYLKRIHSYVMDIRNNYLAHAGYHEFESNAMVAYLSPDPEERGIIQTVYTSVKFYEHTGRREEYQKLTDYVLNIVYHKIECLDNLYANEIESIPMDEMYSNAKIPKKEDAEEANVMSYFDKVNPRL